MPLPLHLIIMCILLPVLITGPFAGGNSQISGSFTTQEAQDLASILRTGKLPAPAKIVQERGCRTNTWCRGNQGWNHVVPHFIYCDFRSHARVL